MIKICSCKSFIPEEGINDIPEKFKFSMRKRMKSYTVRHFDTIKNEITIDFVINDHIGLASNWAKKAVIGDRIGIAGPGDTKHTNLNADWHLFVADITAIPVMASVIEMLPQNANGYAFFQIPLESDKQNIVAPANFKIIWVVNHDINENALLRYVSEIEWLNGEPQILLAGESSQISEIKKYLKSKPGYTKSNVYSSGYWKA